MVTVDGQGSLLSVSPGFLELIGAPVEQLAGSNLVDHVHPDDAATARQLLAAAARGAATVAILVEIFDATGRWSPIELSFEHGAAGRLTFGLRPISGGGAADAEPTPGEPESAPAPVRADPAGSSGGLAGWLRTPAAADPHAAPEPAEPAADALPATAETGPSPSVVLPGEDDDAFPYEDSPERRAHVAAFPGDDIVERRAGARMAAGPVDTPMLEIDGEGRTVHVSGSWADLGDTGDIGASGVTGPDVFEQLLERSGLADAVLQSIDDACLRERSGRHRLQIGGRPPSWIQVTPIPSPHFASETHALVSILTESRLPGSDE